MQGGRDAMVSQAMQAPEVSTAWERLEELSDACHEVDWQLVKVWYQVVDPARTTG
jgi:hypothetical protein